MKRHWVYLQLRFEAPKDVKLEMLLRLAALKWQYIAIVATFSSFILFLGCRLCNSLSLCSVYMVCGDEMQYNVEMTKITCSTYSCFVVTILSLSVFNQRYFVCEHWIRDTGNSNNVNTDMIVIWMLLYSQFHNTIQFDTICLYFVHSKTDG